MPLWQHIYIGFCCCCVCKYVHAHQHFITNHYCKCASMNFLPFVWYVRVRECVCVPVFHILSLSLSFFLPHWGGCLFTGADNRIDAVHALQQHICIHFTQDVSNFIEKFKFVRCVVDLCGRLLLRHSI